MGLRVDSPRFKRSDESEPSSEDAISLCERSSVLLCGRWIGLNIWYGTLNEGCRVTT